MTSPSDRYANAEAFIDAGTREVATVATALENNPRVLDLLNRVSTALDGAESDGATADFVYATALEFFEGRDPVVTEAMKTEPEIALWGTVQYVRMVLAERMALD